jgi:hypothetical protein
LNITDLEKIESSLNIILPDIYKQVMLDYPLRNHKSEQEAIENDPNKVIEINKKFREVGFQGKKWPEHFYIFGKINNNNINFINLDGFDGTIYFATEEKKYNPKNISKLWTSDNFNDFIERCKVFAKMATTD